MFEVLRLMSFEETPLYKKYFKIFDYVIWIVFGSSLVHMRETEMNEKILISFSVIIGLAFNIYVLTEILSIVNSLHSSRMKFYQIMNQLDAYAQKKQLPLYIQKRLQFFFERKFRNYFFNEEYVTSLLSESLRKEILLNTGELFVKNFSLFEGISQDIFIQLFSRCRKEYFLPNDIVRIFSFNVAIPLNLLNFSFNQIYKAGSVGDCNNLHSINLIMF